VVLAAPSGTGKTTMARRLVEGSREFVFSVSATTRPPRQGERNGMDYEFVDEPAFRRMIEAGELVEWAEVHGHLYGTPRDNLERAAERGERVVLDIDVQGARQIRERVPDALLIFVLPPTAAALVARLSGRGTEARAEMLRRLRNAREELLSARDFDHAVVNEELQAAVDAVRRLVRGQTPPERVAPADVDREVERLRAEIDDILAGALVESLPPTD
jgi:guanylate kinase